MGLRYVIQKGVGKRMNKKGVRVQFFDGEKSKSFNVHGYALEQAYNLAYFSFYHDSFDENERLRLESARWGKKRDYYQLKKKRQREEMLMRKSIT